MKKENIPTKLFLSKEVITKLTNNYANQINGGDITNGWWRKSSEKIRGCLPDPIVVTTGSYKYCG